MRRCNRCIMPETVPGVSFQDGVCSFCMNYVKENFLGKESLDRIIALSKNNKQYDCIVPVSGGRDSTFILYMAKAEYNLKVLAVNYDNEFRNNQALVNMENACKILNVDFISIRSRRDIAKKAVLYGIRSAPSFGKFALCDACEYGYRSIVYRAAEEYQVPLILWGESQAESTMDMVAEVSDQSILNRAKKFLKLLNINFYKAEYYRLLQRLEFPVPQNTIFCRKPPTLKNKNIKEIRVFDYIPWNRKKIKDTIMTELGWERPIGNVSTWRTDCTLHSLVNYCFFKLFGCSKDCFGYCKMINSAQMQREEALKQEEEMAANYEKNVREVLEHIIGLSRKEAKKILSFEKEI